MPPALLDCLHDQYLGLLFTLPRRRREETKFQPFLDTVVREVLDRAVLSRTAHTGEDLRGADQLFSESVYRRHGNPSSN